MDTTAADTILVTGGVGYIGSHTVIELFKFLQNSEWKQYKILVVDNLSNSSAKILDRMRKILSTDFPEHPDKDFFTYVQMDILDTGAIKRLFSEYRIWGIIHFAALKSVNESTMKPLWYYETNFIGTFNLLKAMEQFDVRNFVFSSSACVYGNNGDCKEDDHVEPLNPYGATKFCIENMLRDTARAHPEWSVVSLRYFNPCGAHPSGLIGDAPPAFPNNLFPYIEKVVVGQREYLNVYGTDYNTKDGTGVRDYIHVVDLAKGHLAALKKLPTLKGFTVFNLGTGVGCSVLDIVKAYSSVIGREVPHKLEPRRAGDVDILLANVSKANRELEWKTELSLEDMCRDSYRWITQNANGL